MEMDVLWRTLAIVPGRTIRKKETETVVVLVLRDSVQRDQSLLYLSFLVSFLPFAVTMQRNYHTL